MRRSAAPALVIALLAMVITLVVSWLARLPDVDAALARSVILDQARVVVEPQGRAPIIKEVTLRHRWEEDARGRSGKARYTLRLPATANGPMALLFTQIGNQAVVRVGGNELRRLGELGDTAVDTSRQAQRVELPAALLDRADQTTLEVIITAQPLRRGGLGPVIYGPSEAISILFQHHRWTTEYAAAGYACGLMLMGAVAAALWVRRREALYGCFAATALLGIIPQLYPLFSVPLIPWPAWGAIRSAAYGLHLAVLAKFILLVVGNEPRWLRRLGWAVLPAMPALAVLSFILVSPTPWTAALAILQVYGALCFGVVIREAIVTRQPMAWLVLLAGVGLMAAGAHDFLVHRLWVGHAASPDLTKHAVFLFVLLQAGIVVNRLLRSIDEYEVLNQTLELRVAERERQLAQAFEALRTEREAQAVMNERQRIMREIHDGVGSQLVGLLGMVTSGQSSPVDLEESVRVALDEMRMAVDSLQAVEGDLAAVLGTLRYRLQPRLNAAGLEVRWNVDRLPPLPDLPPQSVLQLQRILLEAVTNVLKHAQARTITVEARLVDDQGRPAAVHLALTDDGIGIAESRERMANGHGLQSMRARAAAIGATLGLRRLAGGGTSLILEWPVPR